MYLRKMRPRTTCLYSAASMLLRSLSAASQSLASKPRLAEESFFLVGAFAIGLNFGWGECSRAQSTVCRQDGSPVAWPSWVSSGMRGGTMPGIAWKGQKPGNIGYFWHFPASDGHSLLLNRECLGGRGRSRKFGDGAALDAALNPKRRQPHGYSPAPLPKMARCPNASPNSPANPPRRQVGRWRMTFSRFPARRWAGLYNACCAAPTWRDGGGGEDSGGGGAAGGCNLNWKTNVLTVVFAHVAVPAR